MLLPFYVMTLLPWWLAGAILYPNTQPKEA
jgi:hypothetical protein